jgi:glycosyltransferase involved in cell wall biosynthesis
MSVPPGSGYGNASEAYMLGLQAAGVPVTWTPLGWPSERWDAPLGPVVASSHPAIGRDSRCGAIADLDLEHDTVVVCSTPIWHPRLGSEASGRMLAAYTTWETDRLPADWVPVLNRYDRVLVPSRFNAEVFVSSGVQVPVAVVPHISAPARHRGAAGPGPRGPKFIFYLIATWTTRKAILDAVRAYVSAFTASDAVTLVIHTSREDLVACARLDREGRPRRSEAATWYTLARALAGLDSAPEIVLSTRKLTDRGVEALHTRGDCYFSLSRGEGWGLGAFDAAAHGNPVIVLGWGGPLDFLPGDYPYFVDFALAPTTSDEPDAWWRPEPGERWAKANLEHAACLLRRVVSHQGEAHAWGETLRSTIRSNFSSAVVTRRLLDSLELGALGARA